MDLEAARKSTRLLGVGSYQGAKNFTKSDLPEGLIFKGQQTSTLAAPCDPSNLRRTGPAGIPRSCRLQPNKKQAANQCNIEWIRTNVAMHATGLCIVSQKRPRLQAFIKLTIVIITIIIMGTTTTTSFPSSSTSSPFAIHQHGLRRRRQH